MSTTEFCGICEAYKQVESDSGICRANPPTAHVILVPTRTFQGDAILPQVMSAFPTVQADTWCRAFKHKGTILQ